MSFYITDDEFISLSNKSDLKWPVEFESDIDITLKSDLNFGNIKTKKVIVAKEVKAKKQKSKRELI